MSLLVRSTRRLFGRLTIRRREMAALFPVMTVALISTGHAGGTPTRPLLCNIFDNSFGMLCRHYESKLKAGQTDVDLAYTA